MRLRKLLAASVSVACSVAAGREASASRSFGAPGPLATEVKTLSSSTRVVVPRDGAAHPLLVASHGWSASGDNQIGWAKHFASWGFVVAVPSFPNPLTPDTSTNAGIIADLVSQLEGALASTYAVAKGPYGLEGHSAGGLATAVAAASLAPSAVVLFDPVDKDAAGKAAYAALCAPVLDVFAGSSSCNQNAEWRGFAKDTKGELLAFGVQGSTHCDGENADRPLCGLACGGGASKERQAVMAHYATAFFRARLAGDPTAATELTPAMVGADADLEGVIRQASTCASPAPDGGTGPDGGASSSSSGGSSATASSGGGGGAAPGGDASGGEGDAGGCGCRAAPSSRARAALGACALAIVALLRRRRAR
jgi:dienelactone hydrolase